MLLDLVAAVQKGFRIASKNAFVSKLDARGVDAVIASLTNANAAMAGVFYRCFDAELKDRAADDSPTLAEVFANTIQCVKGHKKINRFIGDNEDDDPIDYYGANAYKYTLLGNGNIRVCLDKGAKP